MTIPENVADWTLQTVVDIVTQHAFETGSFDFKEVLNPSKGQGSDEHAKSIRRTACSFANTDGGFIIFGVQDPRQEPSKAVGELIVGIPDGDLRKDLGGKLAAIQPDVSFETVPRGIPIPSRQGRVVFIAQIPLSPRRPHIYEGYFYRRGAGGAAEHMNVYEVREQMLNTEERLRKLTLLRLEILQFLLMAREFRVSSRKVWEEGRRAMAAH